MIVSRVLHACYIFESFGTRILFDPLFENPFSVNCYAYPSAQFDLGLLRLQKFDAVFISHYHDDHCSFESLNFLDRKTPIYLYCLHNEMFDLIRALGFKHVYPLELDEPIRISNTGREGIEVTPRRAADSDVDSIFQIQAEGLKVLNVVDSWIDDEELARLSSEAPWDLVLWPFQTMREIDVIAPSLVTSPGDQSADDDPTHIPAEWLAALRSLRASAVVPSSCQFIQEEWSWFRERYFPISYQAFSAAVSSALPSCSVLRLDPGSGLELNANPNASASISRAPKVPWVITADGTELDYKYSAVSDAPSSREVSYNFPPICSEQKVQVLDWCRSGLLETFRGLGEASDDFFQKKRLWKLSIDDRDGDRTSLYYQLSREDITLLDHSSDQAPLEVDWSTEISFFKLYQALYEGESLSSIYVRINDQVTPTVRERLRDADVLDDPLLRCLYNGKFASYQKAQLRRINSRLLPP